MEPKRLHKLYITALLLLIGILLQTPHILMGKSSGVAGLAKLGFSFIWIAFIGVIMVGVKFKKDQ